MCRPPGHRCGDVHHVMATQMKDQRTELEGRVALVTGGSGDIGSAIVRALARWGADVVIHCHQNKEQADKLSAELQSLGRASAVAVGDLTREDEARRVAREAQVLGPLDILINNAGTPFRRIPWTELETGFLDQVFGLNFYAPLYLSQELVPGMIERGKGVIINILSTAARIGGTDTVLHYGASKGVLLSFTRGLAQVLAPQGVRVMAVSPGTIDTRIQRDLTSPELLEQLRKATPLGRIGQPEEIGEVVAFMATDYAGFVVGETLDVNGGKFMW